MFTEYGDIMSVYDVAEALGVGRNRVYDLLESGELPGFRIGKVWKIPKKTLEEYVLSYANDKKNILQK